MARFISITDDKKRDAQVALETAPPTGSGHAGRGEGDWVSSSGGTCLGAGSGGDDGGDPAAGVRDRSDLVFGVWGGDGARCGDPGCGRTGAVAETPWTAHRVAQDKAGPGTAGGGDGQSNQSYGGTVGGDRFSLTRGVNRRPEFGAYLFAPERGTSALREGQR